RPIQAREFQRRSSRDSKMNIRPTSVSGLDTIRELNVVDFNYKDNPEQLSTGFIAEESKAIQSDDGKFINDSLLLSYLTLAIQELADKLDVTAKELYAEIGKLK